MPHNNALYYEFGPYPTAPERGWPNLASLLAEALTTSGIVVSRLKNFNEAKKRFEAAYNVSERCGDREGARRALLSMFEEMRERLGHDELRQISEKLQRLQSFSEPSPLSARVNDTITQIASVINKNNQE